MSLHDDYMSATLSSSSLPSSSSTISLASSGVDARQLDSGVDLQEGPRPLNRRSNRDFRIIPTAEMEVVNEYNLQESIRNNQGAHKTTRNNSGEQNGSSRGQQEQGARYSTRQYVKNNMDDDGEESDFGDIFDKYYTSDEDPMSPSTASPTSPFSTAPGWKALKSTQPPTPPISRSFNLPPAITPPRRGTGTSFVAATTASLRNNQSSPDQESNGTRSRNNSTSGSSSSSPMNAASAKFNMYLHNGAVRDSRESLSKATTPPTSTTSTRSYAKRPPPPPKDIPSTSSPNPSAPGIQPRTSSTSSSSSTSRSPHQPGSSHSTRNHINGNYHRNDSSLDLRESRPEPPPKDSSRRAHHNYGSGNSNNDSISNSRNSSGSQPPVLSLDTQHSGHINFSDVVEASMSRHRASPSVSSTVSGYSHNADRSSQSQSNSHSQPSSRTRSSSNQSYSSFQSHQGMSRSSDQMGQQNGRQEHLNQGQLHKHDHRREHGNEQEYNRSSQSQSRHEQSNIHGQRQQSTPLQDAPYRMHGSTSQLDLTGSGYRSSATLPSNSSRSSSQAPPYLNERGRSHSHGSVPTTSTQASYGYSSSSRGVKSALVKTPIARARAREAHGPRKVIFGDMITIVTVERVETPPPLPPLDKKARKKLQQAKKNASSKGGKGQTQNFDPEYDAAYYNAPYTPTPAEVVVTLAPWIGNPNYDEERANSKFYFDDEIDYDDEDYDYDTPYESDLRLGPEDDDDEDDEDDDDEDDEDYVARPWGHGIAGPGGALPKKKGGMFKFKRAVNRLLRN
ncbi:hypothetical protein BGZ50_007303 [Haplosporangium sp. Z 11]|nr:hypothetical protein BGZ50_007303 [Haplosporangium sp. Z 11]